MQNPKISIIVSTYGRNEHLKKLLDSLRTSAPLEAYELLIISSDPPETEKIAWLKTQSDIKLILADARKPWQLRKKSAHYYINLGIKKSHNEWIIVVNDDMYFLPDWYSEFVKFLGNPDHSNAGMIIVAAHVGNVESGLRIEIIGKTKKPGREWRNLYLSDVCITRKDVLETIGLYDEHLDWFGAGADNSLAVEFLTTKDTIPCEYIKIGHSIAHENRGTNMGDSFSDFHYLINKWNRWCQAHDCQYVWDPGLPPYTLRNRIENYIKQKRKILHHYKKYFLAMRRK